MRQMRTPSPSVRVVNFTPGCLRAQTCAATAAALLFTKNESPTSISPNGYFDKRRWVGIGRSLLMVKVQGMGFLLLGKRGAFAAHNLDAMPVLLNLAFGAGGICNRAVPTIYAKGAHQPAAAPFAPAKRLAFNRDVGWLALHLSVSRGRKVACGSYITHNATFGSSVICLRFATKCRKRNFPKPNGESCNRRGGGEMADAQMRQKFILDLMNLNSAQLRTLKLISSGFFLDQIETSLRLSLEVSVGPGKAYRITLEGPRESYPPDLMSLSGANQVIHRKPEHISLLRYSLAPAGRFHGSMS